MIYIPFFLKEKNENVRRIFTEIMEGVTQKTENLFTILLVSQWIMGVVFAELVSPLTWSGGHSQTHIHIYAAVFLGGIIAAFPLFMIKFHPGKSITRQVVTIAQVLYSALLIHLTGGRIETHFYIFGSLAFLAFFRDWRVILTATIIVTLDHFLRGMYWPESVYGVLSATPWRTLEHAGWVVFEDIVLVYSIRLALREVARVAEKEDQLSHLNQTLEQRVAERTLQLEKSQAENIKNARAAGMSEIASDILHNVGNVLNSANVGAESIQMTVSSLPIEGFAKANALLKQNIDKFDEFYTSDNKGKKLLEYYLELGQVMTVESDNLAKEASSLLGKLQLIKDIVNTQQTFAKNRVEFKERVILAEVIESALALEASSLLRHEITLIKKFSVVPPVFVEKTKLTHVLLNIIKNAKEAMSDGGSKTKRALTIEICNTPEGVSLKIGDTGVGIAKENISKVFSHGFTTKTNGHGFGLHFCANAIGEMNGKMSVFSDGPGKGTTFKLLFIEKAGKSAA